MSDWTKDQEWLDEFIRTTITSNLISPLDAVAKLAVYIRDVVEKRLKHFMEAPSEYEDARLESIEKRLKALEPPEYLAGGGYYAWVGSQVGTRGDTPLDALCKAVRAWGESKEQDDE